MTIEYMVFEIYIPAGNDLKFAIYLGSTVLQFNNDATDLPVIPEKVIMIAEGKQIERLVADKWMTVIIPYNDKDLVPDKSLRVGFSSLTSDMSALYYVADLTVYEKDKLDIEYTPLTGQ